MQKRKAGQPHKGWKNSARKRHQSPRTEELTASISKQAQRVGATFVPSAEKIATYEAAQAARQPEAEPVALADRLAKDIAYDFRMGPVHCFNLTPHERDLIVSSLRAGGWREDMPRYRHKKRGSECTLIGVGKMQAEHWRDPDVDADYDSQRVDMREVTIYRVDKDGSLWARPREEFEDGRFERLPSATKNTDKEE